MVLPRSPPETLSFFSAPVRALDSNLLWMEVNVLKVDVLSSPSSMSICGLGCMPEIRLIPSFELCTTRLIRLLSGLLHLEHKHLNTLVSLQRILSVEVRVARSLCWRWRSALGRERCLCSPLTETDCFVTRLDWECLKWLPVQTILPSALKKKKCSLRILSLVACDCVVSKQPADLNENRRKSSVEYFVQSTWTDLKWP